jgi:hypothetical protein
VLEEPLNITYVLQLLLGTCKTECRYINKVRRQYSTQMFSMETKSLVPEAEHFTCRIIYSSASSWF